MIRGSHVERARTHGSRRDRALRQHESVGCPCSLAFFSLLSLSLSLFRICHSANQANRKQGWFIAECSLHKRRMPGPRRAFVLFLSYTQNLIFPVSRFFLLFYHVAYPYRESRFLSFFSVHLSSDAATTLATHRYTQDGHPSLRRMRSPSHRFNVYAYIYLYLCTCWLARLPLTILILSLSTPGRALSHCFRLHKPTLDS